MFANIITVINQKGGVGKTTTAQALGIGLANKCFKVLFVDLDGQCNLSYILNADPQKPQVLDLLTYKAKIQEVIQQTAKTDIIAATSELAGADGIITATGKEYRLKEALEQIKKEYDYIVIDTPPALGILTVNALTASQKVLITAQADIFSLQGIAQVSETINAVRQYCNKDLSIAGILLTRYNDRTIISRDIAGTLQNTAKTLNTRLFRTAIRENIAIKEAHAARQDIYEYASESAGAIDYKEFVKEFISRGNK